MENAKGANVLSMKDVAKVLGRLRTRNGEMVWVPMSLITLRKWVKEGKLTGHRLGREFYFLKEELDADLERIGVTKPKNGAEA